MEKEALKDVLDDVEFETIRFLQRLDRLKDRIENEPDNPWAGWNNKESAALKRSALDLKNELTRITQSRM